MNRTPALLDLDVPPVATPEADALPGLDWLRANVARFSCGEAHRRRRELVEEWLRPVAVDELWSLAATETTTALRGLKSGPFDVMSTVARVVPVAVLGRAIGRPIEPMLIDVMARALRPDATPQDRDDEVVREALASRSATEHEAAAIGLLVQTCDATAGLIGNALLGWQGDLDAVLASTPPVRTTRRVDQAGQPVVIDLAALDLPFGAGAHSCPGAAHALALAGGVVSTLISCCSRDGTRHTPERSSNLDMPARLLLVVQ